MTDIAKPTDDITIFSSDGANSVGVTVNNELQTISSTENTKLDSIITLLNSPPAASAPDLWQYLSYAGMCFQTVTSFTTIAGQTETDFMLFRNPAGSGKTIRIHDLDYTYNKGSAIALVKQYLTPTITSVGSANAITKKYIGFATNSVALVYISPTISVRGTLIKSFGQSAVGTYQDEKHLAYIIPAGYDLLFTVQPAANNTDHSLFLDWAEV